MAWARDPGRRLQVSAGMRFSRGKDVWYTMPTSLLDSLHTYPDRGVRILALPSIFLGVR